MTAQVPAYAFADGESQWHLAAEPEFVEAPTLDDEERPWEQVAEPYFDDEPAVEFVPPAELKAEQRRNGATPARQERELDNELDAIAALDLTELLSGPIPRVDWLWHKWIAQGELVLFVATAGTGKSIAALLLACAARLGTPLLGADCKHGHSGYIDFENPKPVVHLRLRQAGLTADDHEGFVYYHFPPIDLCSTEGEQWLRETIERHQLVLVVLDSFRRIAPGVDENDSAAVSGFFQPLRRIAVATGCTILVLHHPKKRQHDSPDDAIELVRGSGDFTAAVDTLLFARRKAPNTFTLEGIGKRTGYSHKPILVRISPPDADTLELTNEGDVAYAEDQVERMLARIVTALEDDGGALERQALALRVESDPKNNTFTRALKLGWQRELLAKSPRVVGSPTLYSLAARELG